MSRFRHVPVLLRVLAACLAALPLFAPAQPMSVRPGAWNVIAGAEGGARAGYQLCFKTGDINDIALLLPRAAGGAACSAASSHVEGGELIWELGCPASGVAVNGRYALTPESIEGRVDIVSGNPPRTRLQVISARHAGACAAP